MNWFFSCFIHNKMKTFKEILKDLWTANREKKYSINSYDTFLFSTSWKFSCRYHVCLVTFLPIYFLLIAWLLNRYRKNNWVFHVSDFLFFCFVIFSIYKTKQKSVSAWGIINHDLIQFKALDFFFLQKLDFLNLQTKTHADAWYFSIKVINFNFFTGTRMGIWNRASRMGTRWMDRIRLRIIFGRHSPSISDCAVSTFHH